MRRIGVCTWTWRPLKGTSRAIRRREWHKFRQAAAIVNEVYCQVQPAVTKAWMDSLIWGSSYVEIGWDDKEGQEVVTVVHP